MITIKDFMTTVDYRITEGSDYGWQCYGPNAYRMDSWNGDQNGHSISMVFDTRTQTVYEISAYDYVNDRAYRWINPEYRSAHDNESEDRGVLGNQAWDDVNYIDLEVAEDMLEKARAIAAEEEYDTRVQVPVDFTDQELLTYMKLAHDRDITFNQLVEEALRAAINDFNLPHVTNTDNPIDFPKPKKKKKDR
jgi:hypothetical protein